MDTEGRDRKAGLGEEGFRAAAAEPEEISHQEIFYTGTFLLTQLGKMYK